MIEKKTLAWGKVYDYEFYKDCIAFIPEGILIFKGSLCLRHYRTPPEYVARLIGYDPVVILQRQFIKYTKTVNAKTLYPCGQKKRLRTEYQFPLPDGIYEVQLRCTKSYKKKFGISVYAQRVFLKFFEGKLMLIKRQEALREVLGEYYDDSMQKNY